MNGIGGVSVHRALESTASSSFGRHLAQPRNARHGTFILWLLSIPLLLFSNPGTIFLVYGQSALVLASNMTYGSELTRFYTYATFPVALAVAAASVILRPAEFVRRLPPMLLFVAFAALCASSAMWSANPYDSLKLAATLSCIFLYAVGLSCFLRPGEAAVVVVCGLLSQMLMSFAVIIILPKYGIHGPYDGDLAQKWRGIFDHKNLLGQVMGCVVPLLLFFRHQVFGRPSVGNGIFAVALVMLAMTGSAGGIVVAVAGSALFYGSFRVKNHNNRVIAWCIIIIVLLVTLIFANDTFNFMLGTLGRDKTLTGRTGTWILAFQLIAQKPFFGYGFAAPVNRYFVEMLIEELGGNAFNNVHNGYLDVVISVGFVGLGILLSALLSAVHRGVRALRMLPAFDRQGVRILLLVEFCWLIAALSDSAIRVTNPLGSVGFFTAALLALSTAEQSGRSMMLPPLPVMRRSRTAEPSDKK